MTMRSAAPPDALRTQDRFGPPPKFFSTEERVECPCSLSFPNFKVDALVVRDALTLFVFRERSKIVGGRLSSNSELL